MVLENLLAGAVAVLAMLMIVVWVARTILCERGRTATKTEPSDRVLITRRRVRQLDQVLLEIGVAFLLAAVGYVTLGVMPA